MAARALCPGIDPGQARVPAEPPVLATLEPPGARRRSASTASSSVEPPVEVVEQLAVAERLTGGHRQPTGPSGQLAHLVEPTGGQLGSDAGLDAPVELVALQAQPDDGIRHGRVHLEAGPVGREGPTAADGHLQRPHHPPTVGRLHPTCGHRVEAGQASVEGGGVGFGLELGPHVGVATGQLEVVDHGPEVQAGAADQHRPPTPLGDVGQRQPGGGLELRDGEVLVRRRPDR